MSRCIAHVCIIKLLFRLTINACVRHLRHLRRKIFRHLRHLRNCFLKVQNRFWMMSYHCFEPKRFSMQNRIPLLNG